MGVIVAAATVPHTPYFPALVARDGDRSEIARLYREVREHLEAADPDVIVIFDADHLSTFFYDNMPTFCVGLAEVAEGPNDQTAGLPHYRVPLHSHLGRHILDTGINTGFDLSFTQKFTVDHSVLVPLHFLFPLMDTPVVPIYVRGLVPPLPLARRCHALGRMVRQAVESIPAQLRVAIVASGSINHEVAGPRVHPGEIWGAPDPAWLERVVSLLDKGDTSTLLEEATTERMRAAGNVAGELLNTIALLGAIGERRPVFLEPQPSYGHAYGAWRWDLNQ